ncbi:unnamed protein product [Polarella glacialis]|uniref:S1 motif domain-containing protein n=1 Tax=Polarella glacialis TaxID=89957 RepID=A0A813JKD5_POLGL|nr:unnamed protein product [Polarella glacialis]CAE8679312.1 unnamed protein product [Polarella glacialis]
MEARSTSGSMRRQVALRKARCLLVLGLAGLLLGRSCCFAGIARPQTLRGGPLRRFAEGSGGAGAGEKVPLSELAVGQTLQGTVIRPFSFSGVFVDVGSTATGFLEYEEIVDGFTTRKDYKSLMKGLRVNVRVLENDGQKLYLTRRTGDIARPERFRKPPTEELIAAFKCISPADWIEGPVVGMNEKGVWVKLAPPGGEEVRSLLLVENFSEGFEKDVTPGQMVKVRVTAVDVPQKRVFITMKAASEKEEAF